jgi:nickel-dependent lactate racemase
MNFSYGYGNETRTFQVPDRNLLCEVTQNQVEVASTGAEAVREALKSPIGTKRLGELVRPGQKIAVITSDITRPCPSHVILPELLRELSKAGVRDEDITVVFALGSHRVHTQEEQMRLVGREVFDRVRCVDAAREGFVHVGVTRAGTPVDIDPVVAGADVRICVGNIEFHYFAGYSGGAKAIMPGVSTRDAIQKNHSKMVLDAARAGNLLENPLRQDIEEAAAMVGVDFILNVVLDEEKKIVKAVAGDLRRAHEAGCAFLDQLYKIRIPARADIVVTTPGGFPKDINLYQAQKALDNAKHAVRDGGIIILAASCREGLGEKVFEQWMLDSPSPEAMIERIGRDFQLGGHKAAAISMVLKRCRILLVSDLEDGFVRNIFLEPFPTVDAALQEAFSSLGEDSRVIFMPHGGSVLPQVQPANQ